MTGATPVTLDRSLRAQLAECLHFTKATDKQTSQAAFAAIRQALKFHATRIHRVGDIPQPAHIRVSIERIVAAATELLDAIDRSKLPHAVVRSLESEVVRDGTLFLSLTDIQVRGATAIERSKRQQSSGMHIKMHAEALSKAKEQFEGIFDQFGPAETSVPEDRARWKADFVTLCCGRLPAVGTSKGKTAKKSATKDG